MDLKKCDTCNNKSELTCPYCVDKDHYAPNDDAMFLAVTERCAELVKEKKDLRAKLEAAESSRDEWKARCERAEAAINVFVNSRCGFDYRNGKSTVIFNESAVDKLKAAGGE